MHTIGTVTEMAKQSNNMVMKKEGRPMEDTAVRQASLRRTTKETDIVLTLILDGDGSFTGTTGIGFLDHMLTLFAVHGGFTLQIEATGDLDVDTHHTVEDIGIVLGEAFKEALGDKKGIARYGYFYCPMDETLVRTVIDFSGRPYTVFDVEFSAPYLGTMEAEMVREFVYAFAVHSACNLHISCLYGTNNHHKAEAVFKSWAHAVRQAVTRVNSTAVLSSKGVL